MNRSELKTKAKAQIKGKIGILFLITFIISAISGIGGAVLSFIPGGALVVYIVITPAFALSIIRVYLMVLDDKTPEVSDTFSGFDDFWCAFKVTFLVGLYTFLWSLLFIIPGIIKSISYSMSMYILAENKGKSATECINESKAITEGHKAELFVLGLSFIGWAFLCVLTFGIAGIWVVPYINVTFANAYRSLKPVTPPIDEQILEEFFDETVDDKTEEETTEEENTAEPEETPEPILEK